MDNELLKHKLNQAYLEFIEDRIEQGQSIQPLTALASKLNNLDIKNKEVTDKLMTLASEFTQDYYSTNDIESKKKIEEKYKKLPISNLSLSSPSL